MPVMRQDVNGLRDPRRLAAILILVVCGSAIAVWIMVRGDLVGADARAYWGGVRLWLGGGDPLDPPPPYMPYVYWPWSLPLFTPWAALPWETAWFVYRLFSVIVFLWSVTWAYRRHPLATALLVALVTVPLAATLDTGNITLLCAMGIWAAHFVGPRLGGFMWALATALKWFPLALFVVLPPRARLWGLAWGLLLAVLTLAVWPESLRQLDLVIDYPRPIRLDYVLLLWAAVPWIWAHPRWFEWRTWGEQLQQARHEIGEALGQWWRSPGRTRTAYAALVRHGRRFLGLEAAAGPPPAATAMADGRAQPAGPST
jgi:Glycosyltransferase family 87